VASDPLLDPPPDPGSRPDRRARLPVLAASRTGRPRSTSWCSTCRRVPACRWTSVTCRLARQSLSTGPTSTSGAADRIGGQHLDTCFGDLDHSPAGVARVGLASAGGERQLTVWMDEGFRFVQVYTADNVSDPSRRRRGWPSSR
jgi:hypothetical protein